MDTAFFVLSRHAFLPSNSEPLLFAFSPALGDVWGVGATWYIEWMCEAPIVEMNTTLSLLIDSVEVDIPRVTVVTHCNTEPGGLYNTMALMLPIGTNTTKHAEVC